MQPDTVGPRTGFPLPFTFAGRRRGRPIEQKPIVINARRIQTAIAVANDGAGTFLCAGLPFQWHQGAPAPFTALAVAEILVEIEICREKEKWPLLSDAAESRRRAEMMRGFTETAAPEMIRRFESLARSLSEERAKLQVREDAIASLKIGEQMLRRDLGKLRRSLAKYPMRRRPGSPLMEVSKTVERALAEPPMHFPPAWHDAARQIAAAYMVNLDPGAAPSNDRLVRFVGTALSRIGATPGARKAIEGVISTVALLKAR